MLKSPKTNLLADGLIERTSSILDKIALKKTCKKTEKVKVIDRGKEECINFEIRIGGKLCRLVLLYGSPSQSQDNFEAFANNLELINDTATANNTFLTISQLFKSW